MNKFNSLKNDKLIVGFFLVLVLILFILNIWAGLIGGLLSVLVLYRIADDREKLIKGQILRIEKLNEDFDSAAQDSVFNMPFPLILTDQEGTISWYNPIFLKLLEGENVVGQKIEDVMEGFDFDKEIKEENLKSEFELGQDKYILYTNEVTKSDDSKLYVFYFVNNSQYDSLSRTYRENRIGFGHLYIDNYDEIGLGKKGYIKSVIMADIDEKIMTYFNRNGVVVRRFDDEKYLLVTTQKSLDQMRQDRFSILDTIREIGEANDSTITLSSGISNPMDSILESFEESRVAVDLALGRGGDQVVVITPDGHEFFGGRSQAREKRNKVRARVIGNSLNNLIDESNKIFIMGHQNPDMDAIGASIGMLGFVRRKDKEGYLVLNEVNPSIKLIMDEFERVEPDLHQYVIKSEEAFELSDKSRSLIIMLDNHKKEFTEEPRLFDYIDKVVVIDHHRKGASAIEDTVLSYIEPYASSTCELITEILAYMDSDMNISTFEAEAMMAGIVVDTKNFSYQTGVRTFEAASTLRRKGADLSNVKRYFDDNFETVKIRARVIEQSIIINNEIAIGRLEAHTEMNILIAAQAADELLRIQGVKASFVLAETDDFIHVSGRSTGEISVQLILEKMGGGGHLVSAATQLRDMDMDQAEELLVEEINKYYEETKETEDEDNTIEGR